MNIVDHFVKGQSVAHFGAADAPFTAERLNDRTLLHYKLNILAEKLIAFDCDPKGIEILRTHGYEVKSYNLMDDAAPLSGIDVVLFGEIIEHLGDPSRALGNVFTGMDTGSILIVSTPNAFYAQNFINSIVSVENVHEDHVVAFTPVTLKKILVDTGFKIEHQYSTFLERRGKGKISKRLWSKIVPAFPMLAETLVYVAKK